MEECYKHGRKIHTLFLSPSPVRTQTQTLTLTLSSPWQGRSVAFMATARQHNLQIKRLKARRIRGFDNLLEALRPLRRLLRVKEVLARQAELRMPVSDLGRALDALGILFRTRTPYFLERHMGVFRLSFDPDNNDSDSSNSFKGRRRRMVQFTPEALGLLREEERVACDYEPLLVEKVRRLLMLSAERRIPLSKVCALEMELALPRDFSTRFVHSYPQFFRVAREGDFDNGSNNCRSDNGKARGYNGDNGCNDGDGSEHGSNGHNNGGENGGSNGDAAKNGSNNGNNGGNNGNNGNNGRQNGGNIGKNGGDNGSNNGNDGGENGGSGSGDNSNNAGNNGNNGDSGHDNGDTSDNGSNHGNNDSGDSGSNGNYNGTGNGDKGNSGDECYNGDNGGNNGSNNGDNVENGIEEVSFLELTSWDDALAVTYREKQMAEMPLHSKDGEIIPMSFRLLAPKGQRLKLGERKRMNRWQRAHFPSPYTRPPRRGSNLGSGAAGKRSVALIHEFLNLTVEKMANVDKLELLKKEFKLPNRLEALLQNHYCIFYFTTKGHKTVFLKEAFRARDHPKKPAFLIEKDSHAVVRESYQKLIDIRPSRRLPPLPETEKGFDVPETKPKLLRLSRMRRPRLFF